MDKYWERRALANQRDRDRIEETARRSIDSTYQQLTADVQKQVEAHTQKYGPADANKKLTSKELSMLKADYAKKAATAKTPEELVELSRMASVQKLTRTQQLAASIRTSLTRSTMQVIDKIDDTLAKTLYTQYSNQFSAINDLVDFQIGYNQISPTQVNAILQHGYNGTSFSEKLWWDRNRVAEVVGDKLPGMLFKGVDVDEMSKVLAAELDTNRANAQRIVRTEGSYVAGQADKLLYADLGIDSYEFVAALDSRTSEICRPMDGNIYPIKDAQPGVNFPPMHPNCRSTTVPDVDTSDLENLDLPKPETESYPTSLGRDEDDFRQEEAILGVGNSSTSTESIAIGRGKEYLQEFTASEKEALSKYASGDYFFDLRDAYTSGKEYSLSSGEDLFETLMGAIQKSTLQEDTLLYRSMQVSPDWISNLKVGADIDHKFFISTTADFNQAYSYGVEKKVRGQKPVLLQILTPRGTPGAIGMEGIQEVVLLPTTKLRVRRFSTLSKYTQIVVDIVN